jgi:hypothetical protein
MLPNGIEGIVFILAGAYVALAGIAAKVRPPRNSIRAFVFRFSPN